MTHREWQKLNLHFSWTICSNISSDDFIINFVCTHQAHSVGAYSKNYDIVFVFSKYLGIYWADFQKIGIHEFVRISSTTLFPIEWRHMTSWWRHHVMTSHDVTQHQASPVTPISRLLTLTKHCDQTLYAAKLKFCTLGPYINIYWCRKN